MFISKKHIPRRTVSEGYGRNDLALPFLDAMLPAQTPQRKSAAASRTRLCAIEMVHGSAGATHVGTERNYWSPAKEGADFEITETLRARAAQEYLTIISHTDLKPSGGVHSAGSRRRSHSIVSRVSDCAHAKMTEGSDIFNATSLDQIYAQKVRSGHARFRRSSFASKTWAR